MPEHRVLSRVSKSWIALCLALAVLGACSKPDAADTTRRTDPPPPSSVDVPTSGDVPTSSTVAVESAPETPPLPEDAEADDTDSGPRLLLSGRVTFEATGDPAADALLELRAFNARSRNPDALLGAVRETRTDDDGVYRIEVPEAMAHRVRIAHPDAGTLTELLVDESRGQTASRPGDARRIVRDYALPPRTVFAGRVLDADDDTPVANATVTVLAPAPATAPSALDSLDLFEVEARTVADEAGRFRFENLAAGPVLVVVEASGRVPLETSAVAPIEDLVLRLDAEGGVLAGFVYRKSTGAGLDDVHVTLRSKRAVEDAVMPVLRQETRTDSVGAFRFENLPPGTYWLQFKKEPLIPFGTPESFEKGIDLAPGETRDNLALFLYEGHSVRGRVVDRETRAPIAGAKVWNRQGLGPSRTPTITDAEGNYVLTGMTLAWDGIAILIAEKPGYKGPPRGLTVSLPHDETELTRDLEMTPAIAVSGRVRTADGTPLPEAKVVLVDSNHGVRRTVAAVETDGRYRLEATPFTTVFVRAEAPGYAFAVSERIELTDESVENVDLVLKRGAFLGGRVVDSTDAPVANARVHLDLMPARFDSELYQVPDEAVYTQTDAVGAFQFKNIPEGEARVVARKEGYADGMTAPLALRDGERHEDLRLRLETGRVLAGRLTDTQGRPIRDGYVRLESTTGGGPRSSLRTDERGRYRDAGLPEGPYRVTASHPDYEDQVRPAVESGRDDVDFVLVERDDNSVTLIGFVVDAATGAPVEDFTVDTSRGSGGANPPVFRDPTVPGCFTIPALKRDWGYGFSVSAPGYVEWTLLSVRLPEDEDVLEIRVELGQGATLVGRTTTPEGDRPLGGVAVALLPPDAREFPRPAPLARMITDDDGYFAFERVAPKDVQIEFQPPEPYQPLRRTVAVAHGETVDLGDVAMTHGGAVRGRVFRSPGDTPAPDIEVHSMPNQPHPVLQTTRTDAAGVFAFENLSLGFWIFTVPEYNTHHAICFTNDTLHHEIVLRIGTAGLRGRARHAGHPLPVSVTLINQQGSYASTRTDASGRFEFTGLYAGTHTIKIEPTDGPELEIRETLELTEGETLERDFEFPDE